MFYLPTNTCKEHFGWLANQILIRNGFGYIAMVRLDASLLNLPRSVSARLVERFIFNFRLSPSALGDRLPVPWLRPQILNGWSVVSFCILRIERLMLQPIPSIVGLQTICCAYRCGVIDSSGAAPQPSVYIVGRNTDRQFLSLMAPAIFESPMPQVWATIEHGTECTQIVVRSVDERLLFSAEVFPAKQGGDMKSNAFGSLQEFVKFIKDGVSSYARSTTAGRYSRIDLRKQDAGYESMEAVIRYNQIDYDWPGSGLEYDSTVRAGGGGSYVWTFKGKYQASMIRRPAELTA